jgi:tetratricopeptide (TPR) repeat protein
MLVGLAIISSSCGQTGNAPTPAMPSAIESNAPSPFTPSAALGTGDDYFRQGNELSSAGRYAEAESAYRQAIAIDPNKAAYWHNLGVTYYQLQRLQDAERSLKSGLQLAPDDAQLNYLLGIVYLQLMRYDDSGDYLLKANELDPTLPEPYYGLGALYKQQGKREEAIQAFEKFLEIGPGQDADAVPNAQAELDALRAGN